MENGEESNWKKARVEGQAHDLLPISPRHTVGSAKNTVRPFGGAQRSIILANWLPYATYSEKDGMYQQRQQ